LIFTSRDTLGIVSPYSLYSTEKKEHRPSPAHAPLHFPLAAIDQY
jgi:hypothetical protein